MKRFNITINGTAYDVAVEEVNGGGVAPVMTAAAPAPKVAPAAPKAAPAAVSGGTTVSSPMPGTIMAVKVAVGDTIKEAQVLVVLEAMKMENDIVAPKAGKVVAVNVKKGDSVNSNDALVIIQ